jgi:hypothetical protein
VTAHWTLLGQSACTVDTSIIEHDKLQFWISFNLRGSLPRGRKGIVRGMIIIFFKIKFIISIFNLGFGLLLMMSLVMIILIF